MKNKKLFIDKIVNSILVLTMVFSLNINSFFVFAEELDNNSTENNIESSEILENNIDENKLESEEKIENKDEENNISEEDINDEDSLSEEESSDIKDKTEIEEIVEEEMEKVPAADKVEDIDLPFD